MSSRTFLIIVPYKARDLEGHALVGTHLRALGHRTVFTNGYGIEHKLRAEAPDVLVIDHLTWNHKARQVAQAQSQGTKVAVLPTEGLLHKPEDLLEMFGTRWGSPQHVDLVLCWGPWHQRALVESGLFDAGLAPVVGSPRFDFYAKPFAPLYRTRDEFGRALGFDHPDRPIILWATNTPYMARDPADVFRRYVGRAGVTRERVQSWLDDERTQFREHRAAVLEAARANPDKNFIVKVHPAEWIRSYVDLPRESANIRLGYDAPIREFLWHSDLLLQRNCTTATEWWMLGKPVIQMEIGSYQRGAAPEYIAGSDVVTTSAELVERVPKSLADPEPSPEQVAARHAFISEFYFRVDGLAAFRCAQRLEELASSIDETAHQMMIGRASEELAREVADENKRLPNRLKDVLGIDRKTSLRFWKRLSRKTRDVGSFEPEAEITPDMVEPLMDQFAGLVGEHVS